MVGERLARRKRALLDRRAAEAGRAERDPETLRRVRGREGDWDVPSRIPRAGAHWSRAHFIGHIAGVCCTWPTEPRKSSRLISGWERGCLPVGKRRIGGFMKNQFMGRDYFSYQSGLGQLVFHRLARFSRLQSWFRTQPRCLASTLGRFSHQLFLEHPHLID